MWRKFHTLLESQSRAGIVARALLGSAGLRIAGMGLGFLVGVLLARGLGPSGYGVYGIAMSVFSILMLPTEFGLPQLVTREVAALAGQDRTEEISLLLGWSIKFVLVTSLLIAVFLIPITLFDNGVLESDLRIPLLWGCAFMVLVAVGNIASSALRGFHRIVQGQYAEILIRPALLACLLALILVFQGKAALTPSIAMLFNALAALAACYYAFSALSRHIKVDYSANLVGSSQRKWLSSSMPLALGDGMRIVSGHLAVLVMGFLATREEVGIYRVAFGIYTVATLPSALLNAVCSPMLSTLHQENNVAAIQRMNAWMALFLTVMAVACLIPFLFAGEGIIGFVFGNAYADADRVLVILLVGELLSSLLGHPTIVLNMMHQERQVVRCSVAALSTNALVCLLLIPVFGAIGAAFGVAVSQFIWRALATRYAHRVMGLNTSILAWVMNPKGNVQ